MGRILGSVATGTSNGSITNGGLSAGTPFWQVIPVSKVGTNGGSGGQYGSRIPVVSVSGTTLSWSFPAKNGQDPFPVTGALVIYGVM